MRRPEIQRLVRVTIDVLVTMNEVNITPTQLTLTSPRRGAVGTRVIRRDVKRSARAGRDVYRDLRIGPLMRTRVLTHFEPRTLEEYCPMSADEEDQLLKEFYERHAGVNIQGVLFDAVREEIVDVRTEVLPPPGAATETHMCVYCGRTREPADLAHIAGELGGLKCRDLQECERDEVSLPL